MQSADQHSLVRTIKAVLAKQRPKVVAFKASERRGPCQVASGPSEQPVQIGTLKRCDGRLLRFFEELQRTDARLRGLSLFLLMEIRRVACAQASNCPLDLEVRRRDDTLLSEKRSSFDDVP